MISYVKPPRLHARFWLVVSALGGLALNVHAQQEIPFQAPKNTIEFKAAGNEFTWQTVTGDTPRSAQPYRPDLSGGTVSNVEPKVKWSPQLPYEHKGGASVKAAFSAVASKAAVVGAAAKELSKGALACGIKPSSPLQVSLAIAGCMGGGLLLGAAIDWGWHQLMVDDSGNVSAVVPSPNQIISDGYMWSNNGVAYDFYSQASACAARGGVPANDIYGCNVPTQAGGTTYVSVWRRPGTCANGQPVTGGQCGVDDRQTVSLVDALTDHVMNKPWAEAQSKVLAGVLMAGHNVFTDGTSGTITGPNSVPLGTSAESWPVNVLPGTTTEAPAGHTGSTDPGIKTTTTAKQANNTYSGNKQTTTTSGTTTTSVTNNVTNNTTTNVTNTYTNDDAPKEEKPEFCEKNPDSLACAEADTPEQDVPKSTLNITYEYADIFGNGACPSDLYLSTHGMNLKVWDWAMSCDHIQDYFRPVLLMCCAFIAFVIVAGGAKE